jgi:hypothetical protein
MKKGRTMMLSSHRGNARWWIAMVGWGFMVAAASPLFADIIELRDGGVLVGKVLNPQGGQTVKIETDDGTVVEIERKLVKIRASMERDLGYSDKVQGRADTLEDHRAIVEECMKQQMQTLANAHRERIVELDPSDRASWDHLKYFKDESSGKWLRREVVMYRRGKIKGEKGRWYTWQEKALMDLDRKYTEQRVAAEKELNQRLKGLDGGARQQAEARAYFDNLNNPLVINKLLTMFREEGSKDRSFYMGLLQKMPPRAVAPAMISIALEDLDMNFVNEAIEYLNASDDVVREMALGGFAAKLKNKQTRDRAAYCMAPFADERFIGMLIGSLLSSDLVVPAGPPGTTNAGFSSNGGVGFSTGAPQPQQRTNQHKNVLSTLQQLTGQNFGYDIEAWQQWFAEYYAFDNLDLRRDEY